jgi:uncharacterized protein YndB with AHSA1/START domain
VDADAFVGSIHVEAPCEVVFEYFTRADALAEWMGDRAIVDPRPGGLFIVFFEERAVEGRYVEVEPPRRLVVTWGRSGSPTFPPHESTLEVTLTPERGGTRVDIVHTGLPPSERERHALGWRYYLERLAAVGAGRPVDHSGTPEELTRGADGAGSGLV